MYQQKDSQTATLYGRVMSPLEARGIVSEVAAVAERIDRVLEDAKCEAVFGHQQREDLRSYWENLFGRDLDSVLSSVAAHHFHDTPQAKDYVELWKNEIEGRTTELLMFGFVENHEFLKQAINSLPLLARPAEIINPAEPELSTQQALRRLGLLESLFKSYPLPGSLMQSLYIHTEAYGVVTLLRYRQSSNDDFQYAIGINIQNASGNTAGFVFDHEGQASPLRMVNSVGVTARLKAGFKPPTADQLCTDFVDAVIYNPKALNFQPPAEPNTGWFL